MIWEVPQRFTNLSWGTKFQQFAHYSYWISKLAWVKHLLFGNVKIVKCLLPKVHPKTNKIPFLKPRNWWAKSVIVFLPFTLIRYTYSLSCKYWYLLCCCVPFHCCKSRIIDIIRKCASGSRASANHLCRSKASDNTASSSLSY